MAQLSPGNLTIAIDSARAMLKPPALAVIQSRREILPQKKAKVGDPSAKAKAKGAKDKRPVLTEEDTKALGEWGLLLEVTARQREIFTGLSQAQKKEARSLTRAEAFLKYESSNPTL